MGLSTKGQQSTLLSSRCLRIHTSGHTESNQIKGELLNEYDKQNETRRIDLRRHRAQHSTCTQDAQRSARRYGKYAAICGEALDAECNDVHSCRVQWQHRRKMRLITRAATVGARQTLTPSSGQSKPRFKIGSHARSAMLGGCCGAERTNLCRDIVSKLAINIRTQLLRPELVQPFLLQTKMSVTSSVEKRSHN